MRPWRSLWEAWDWPGCWGIGRPLTCWRWVGWKLGLVRPVFREPPPPIDPTKPMRWTNTVHNYRAVDPTQGRVRGGQRD
jgi:hypothetical protein